MQCRCLYYLTIVFNQNIHKNLNFMLNAVSWKIIFSNKSITCILTFFGIFFLNISFYFLFLTIVSTFSHFISLFSAAMRSFTSSKFFFDDIFIFSLFLNTYFLIFSFLVFPSILLRNFISTLINLCLCPCGNVQDLHA